jgi:hypothetical protein
MMQIPELMISFPVSVAIRAVRTGFCSVLPVVFVLLLVFLNIVVSLLENLSFRWKTTIKVMCQVFISVYDFL